MPADHEETLISPRPSAAQRRPPRRPPPRRDDSVGGGRRSASQSATVTPRSGRRRAATSRKGVSRRRRRRTPLQRFLIGGCVVLAVALVGLLGVIGWGAWQFHRIDRVDLQLRQAGLGGPVNILVVGSDTRSIVDDGPDAAAIFGDGSGTDAEPGGQRADSMMLVRVDAGAGTIEELSIPRDLWVTDPSSGRQSKLNAAYNNGPQRLVDTIQSTFGVTVNHYVEVNFASFKGLVEAVGGIDLYFDRPVRDRNTGLNVASTGCQRLDGTQALAFARSRHLQSYSGSRWVEDKSADMGRITRQQVFLRRALRKLSTLDLADLNTIRRLVGVAVDNVKIDASLSAEDIVALGRRFAGFDPDKLVTHRVPTLPDSSPDGQAILRLDNAAAGPVLDVFSGRAPSTAPSSTVAPAPPAPGRITVDVLNGSGVGGQARKIGQALATEGFVSGTVGNTSGVSRTVVRTGAGAGARAAGELVARYLSTAPSVEVDTTLPPDRVKVVLGADGAQVVTPAAAPAASAAPTSAPATTAPPPDRETIGQTVGEPPAGVTCG